MPESPVKRIIAVMSDLFFSAKISDAAKKLGMTVEFVKDKAVALEKAKVKPAMVLIDLNCDAADPLDLISQLKADPETKDIATVGFVSHVQTDLMKQASALDPPRFRAFAAAQAAAAAPQYPRCGK